MCAHRRRYQAQQEALFSVDFYGLAVLVSAEPVMAFSLLYKPAPNRRFQILFAPLEYTNHASRSAKMPHSHAEQSVLREIM